MENSPLIKSSARSIPSPDGRHLASLKSPHLEIRRISTLDVVRTITVSPSTAKFLCVKWAPVSKGLGVSTRFLVADEDMIRVFDLNDDRWSAKIDNGSGGMGKIATVEFGADDTELLVFSAFHAQVTVWDLWSGVQRAEIKDPKFAAKSRGRNRVFALLSRPAAQDVVTLHAPGSYAVIKTFNVPTIDAQGMKWSPDGKWLAIWDTATYGYKVHIYTADGNLYRTYAGDYFDDKLAGLGVKTIEWSPSGDFLAVGGYDQAVTLLSTKTFSPAVQLSHRNTVSPFQSTILVEQVASSSPSSRSYNLATAPVSPPTAAPNTSSNAPQAGMSILAFNSTGSLVATKSESHPTTVWIWDLSTLRSRAIFVQHSVVRRLAWHHGDPDLLLIQCIQDDGALYVWNARGTDSSPRVLALPTEVRLSSKADARWLLTSQQKRPAVIVSETTGCALVWPDGREPESPQLAANAGQGTDDDDSLFDILSGRDTAPADLTIDADFDAQQGLTVQDTFDFRRGVPAH